MPPVILNCLGMSCSCLFNVGALLRIVTSLNCSNLPTQSAEWAPNCPARSFASRKASCVGFAASLALLPSFLFLYAIQFPRGKVHTYLPQSLIHNSRCFWMLIWVNRVFSFPITLHYEVDISAIENAKGPGATSRVRAGRSLY